jgi:mannose/fructose/N-acetylgalactosamine-specific phosphotransferase system component IIB
VGQDRDENQVADDVVMVNIDRATYFGKERRCTKRNASGNLLVTETDCNWFEKLSQSGITEQVAKQKNSGSDQKSEA